MPLCTAALAGHRPGMRQLNAWIAAAAMFAAACCAATSAHADTSLTRPNDGSSSKLSDTAATEETRNVYSFIKTRTSKINSNMILGQHMGGPGDLIQSEAFDMVKYRIESATPGRHAYPRLIGARYDALANGVYRLDSGLIDQINARLIEVSNIYHPIVSITATPRNPWDQSKGRNFVDGQGKLTDLARANRGSVPAAKLFWDDIDTIADGLAKLKTADGKPVPVLLRPFAEVNTSDKYYYRQQTGANFVALWRDVADYYVNTRQLHNLIFVWEAWVWNRTGFETHNIVPWFPAKQSDTDNPWVDVVTGAFYFDAVDPRFSLNFTAGTNDEKVFYDLMGLARTHNKPFGAAQWSVNYTKPGDPCTQGDNNNALLFMKSVDDRHYVDSPTTQHLSFVYYWGDNNYCMAVQNQLHATEFVDDLRVASVTGIDAINTESGRIVESGQGTGVGGLVTPGLPLRTGDNALNRQIKSVLSFDTSAAMLPANATLGDAPASIVLKKADANGTFPAGLSDLGLEAANVLGSSTALAAEDFNAPATPLGGKVNDPNASFKGQVSYGSVPIVNVNRSGRTQLRLAFKTPTDGNGISNLIDWLGQTAAGPELILTYTLPNSNP